MMTVLFTAWGYELTILEALAFITSVIGVGLGVFGPRATWPWWNISSLLYAALFFESKYYASAALQLIFIAGGIWGWFGWGKAGAIPQKLQGRSKIFWFVAYFAGWFSLYPVLKSIGAAASLTDAFGFVGSCFAQILMVLQKYEAWIFWFVVDAVYTYQFFHGKYYLTSILYFIFVLIAIAGWLRWYRSAHNNAQNNS